MNHSCDPNVALVFMHGGACAVFALRPVPKGHVLYSNYGVHYATHSRAERRELLEKQYHFQCECTPCIDNWSQLNFQNTRLICQHCRCPFIADKVNNYDQSADSCQCSVGIRLRTVLRFQKLVQQNLQVKSTSIPAYYQATRFDKIEAKAIKKHLTYLTTMLDESHLSALLVRPALPFDWSQELLKTLLSLYYGSGYAENANVYLPTADDN